MGNEEAAKILIAGQREATMIKEKTELGKTSVDVLTFASIRPTITIPSTMKMTGWGDAAVRRALARLSEMKYLETYINLKRAGSVKHYRITGVGRRMINKYLEACRKG
jgi:DNA-binding MarR family transcriptional regulator